MPVARNMMQLNNMLMRELKNTMKKVRKKSKEDMKEATKWFYDGGEVSFTAYLDKSHIYTTGDNPDMEQVLYLANDGVKWITSGGYYARDTVGNQRFWERAEANIEKDFRDTLSKTFMPV